MAELILSASSVDAYRTCPQRWYLQYVENHEGDQNVARSLGLAVHSAAEAYYKTFLEEDRRPSVEEAQDAFDFCWAFEASAIADPDEDLVKARQIGRRVTQSYIEDVASNLTPWMVEQPGQIGINGIEYSFHVDLIDDDGIVHDTKVKGSKPRDPSVFLFAATGYALAYRALTGQIEKDVVYDVMIRLKRDRPYHLPYANGGPISKQQIGFFARQLQLAADGIERGDFRPLGLENGMCKWCPVMNVCDYYQATLEPTVDEMSEALELGNTAAGHEHWGES